MGDLQNFRGEVGDGRQWSFMVLEPGLPFHVDNTEGRFLKNLVVLCGDIQILPPKWIFRAGETFSVHKLKEYDVEALGANALCFMVWGQVEAMAPEELWDIARTAEKKHVRLFLRNEAQVSGFAEVVGQTGEFASRFIRVTDAVSHPGGRNYRIGELARIVILNRHAQAKVVEVKQSKPELPGRSSCHRKPVPPRRRKK